MGSRCIAHAGIRLKILLLLSLKCWYWKQIPPPPPVHTTFYYIYTVISPSHSLSVVWTADPPAHVQRRQIQYHSLPQPPQVGSHSTVQEDLTSNLNFIRFLKLYPFLEVSLIWRLMELLFNPKSNDRIPLFLKRYLLFNFKWIFTKVK